MAESQPVSLSSLPLSAYTAEIRRDWRESGKGTDPAALTDDLTVIFDRLGTAVRTAVAQGDWDWGGPPAELVCAVARARAGRAPTPRTDPPGLSFLWVTRAPNPRRVRVTARRRLHAARRRSGARSGIRNMTDETSASKTCRASVVGVPGTFRYCDGQRDQLAHVRRRFAERRGTGAGRARGAQLLVGDLNNDPVAAGSGELLVLLEHSGRRRHRRVRRTAERPDQQLARGRGGDRGCDDRCRAGGAATGGHVDRCRRVHTHVGSHSPAHQPGRREPPLVGGGLRRPRGMHVRGLGERAAAGGGDQASSRWVVTVVVPPISMAATSTSPLAVPLGLFRVIDVPDATVVPVALRKAIPRLTES